MVENKPKQYMKTMTYFQHWHSYSPNQRHPLHGRYHHRRRVGLEQTLDCIVPYLPLLSQIGIC